MSTTSNIFKCGHSKLEPHSVYIKVKKNRVFEQCAICSREYWKNRWKNFSIEKRQKEIKKMLDRRKKKGTLK